MIKDNTKLSITLSKSDFHAQANFQLQKNGLALSTLQVERLANLLMRLDSPVEQAHLKADNDFMDVLKRCGYV